MAKEGNKIINNCINLEIASIIGSASTDVGTLCRSVQNINKWARWKPEKLARRADIPGAMTNAERKANNFGLAIPTVRTSIADAANDTTAWAYPAQPLGDFACLTDFTNCEKIDEKTLAGESNYTIIGYDGDAVAPFIGIQGANDDGTLVLDLGRATSQSNLFGWTGVVLQTDPNATGDTTERTHVTLGDMLANIDGKPLTEWYLAFAFGKISDGNLTLSGWKTADTPISADGLAGGLDIMLTTAEWNQEISAADDYVYFFAASKNAKTTFGGGTGSFIALPFARYTVASGKLVVVRNIMPEGSVATQSTSARIGSALQFSLGNSVAISAYSGISSLDAQTLNCAEIMPDYFDFTITNNGTQLAEFLPNEWAVEVSKSLVSDYPTGAIKANIYRVNGSMPNEQLTDITDGFDLGVGESVNLRIGVADLLLYQYGNKYALSGNVPTKIVRYDVKYKGNSILNFRLSIKCE